MNTAVPPAVVRRNDWPSLPTPPPESFEPRLPVTVVVPYYEAPEALELTLAALEAQTYPRELFEVVVVDDGSRQPLAQPADTALSVKVVHQEDLGFGLARARNNGARAAEGEIFVFLDCDMMPEAGWLAEHARWHHAACDLLTLGFRKHVEVDGITPQAVRMRTGSLGDLFAGRTVKHPEWIERRMARTDDLTSGADDIFRTVTGGNLGVSADFFWDVGGFDETFTQWGSEDIEFGWRSYVRGAVVVPCRHALCWHQGPGATLSEQEKRSLARQQVKISHLIADRRLRDATPGRFFTVPEHVVTVHAEHASTSDVLATTEQVLASEVHDLAVWIEVSPAQDVDWVTGHFGPDPRVSLGAKGGAAEAYPAAPFHIGVTAGADFEKGLIGELRGKLGNAASGWAVLDSGHRVWITRSWALHRARRCGLEVAHFGDVIDLFGAERDFNRAHRAALESAPASARAEPAPDPAADSEDAPDTQHPATDSEAAPGPDPAADSEAAPDPDSASEEPDAEDDVGAEDITGIDNNPGGDYSTDSADAASRARNSGATPASPPDLPPLPRPDAPPPTPSRLRRYSSALFANVRSVRSPRDALRFAHWLMFAVLRRVLIRLGVVEAHPSAVVIKSQPFVPAVKAERPEPPLARYPLGAEIAAMGRRAEAVFAVSSRVAVVGGGRKSRAELRERHVDMFVVDKPRARSRLSAISDAATRRAVTVLSETHPRLAVQAFDSETVNPIGWKAEHSGARARVRTLLRNIGREPAGLSIDAELLGKLRALHHVSDSAGYHSDAVRRAGALAALAATGLPVHIADRRPNPLLERCLGPDLYGLMASGRVVTADGHKREQLSIEMRRLALRDHSLRSRARQLLTSAGIGSAPPSVSVLIPTRRPRRLDAVLATVGQQTYRRLELVLALHGNGFGSDAEVMARAACVLRCPVRIVRLDADQPLGALLNAAVAASSGSLLTKIDDDDFYGSEHIWDLVLAQEYSKAELVAKAAEYIYLSNADKTVRELHRQERTESFLSYAGVSGGVLMISRHALAAAGGWRRVARRVDIALAEDVKKLDGSIYWTHGTGYMRVRHGGQHTWNISESHFLGRASEIRDGCDLAFAGIDISQ